MDTYLPLFLYMSKNKEKQLVKIFMLLTMQLYSGFFQQKKNCFFKNTKRQNIAYLECVNKLSPYKRKVGSHIVPLHTLSILLANCLLFSSLSKDCTVSENISNYNCENSPLLYDI